MDQHDEQNAREDYKQGVRNRKIFTTTDDILGLPSSVFVGCGAVLFGTFLLFTWQAALIMAFVLMPGMYHIHKDDPRALSLWIDVLFQRHHSFEAGTATQRQLIILED